MKILFLINDLNFFVTHRISIAHHMKSKGFQVYIVYGELGGADPSIYIRQGLNLIYVPMYRGSFNPLKNIVSFFHILKAFSSIRPDIAHLITIKAYLFGGIASRILNVPAVVSAVAGLGIIFKKNLFGWIIRKFLFFLFKISFNHSNQLIIFQNNNDPKLLSKWGVLNDKKTRIIKGSGVDLSQFTNLNEIQGTPVVTFASRLLIDKGVEDFIKAAEIIKRSGLYVKFVIAGSIDPLNKYSLKEKDLILIKDKQLVDIIGFQKDIPKLFSKSHIICLPSYYGEGLPKVLMEAAAAQRAIITTNHPGCRDAIVDKKTGILVPIKNPKKLADAIQLLVNNPKLRKSMGIAARELAEKEFSVEKIIQKHYQIYRELISITDSKNYFL